jgi:RNA polymerase sigma-70 factor (ECF subfamily)
VNTIDLRVLARRAQGRDPDAWEAIYRQAHPGLCAYARRRLATEEQAEDAVSETMTRAIDAVDRFEWSAGGLNAWLFGILRNVVLETYRAAGRTGLDPYIEPTSDDPLETVLVNEEAACVRRAFSRLVDDDREVLELRVVAGLDASEVGAVVGKRPGAVRMAQSRALTRLRSLMDGAAP